MHMSKVSMRPAKKSNATRREPQRPRISTICTKRGPGAAAPGGVWGVPTSSPLSRRRRRHVQEKTCTPVSYNDCYSQTFFLRLHKFITSEHIRLVLKEDYYASRPSSTWCSVSNWFGSNWAGYRHRYRGWSGV